MQPIGKTKNHTTSWGGKCPKNSNISHNQTSGDRYRSPWSCFFKSRIRETKHISTNADSSTDTKKILLVRQNLPTKKIIINRAILHPL